MYNNFSFFPCVDNGGEIENFEKKEIFRNNPRKSGNRFVRFPIRSFEVRAFYHPKSPPSCAVEQQWGNWIVI